MAIINRDKRSCIRFESIVYAAILLYKVHWIRSEHQPLKPLNSWRSPIYVINSVDYTKLPCYISYRRSTTVSIETYPIINLHESQLPTSYARSKRLVVPQNITRWLGLNILLRREFSQALQFYCSYTDILDLSIVTEN